MSEYRRAFIPGGTFFFTVVTERRAPLFADEAARQLLGTAMRLCNARFPVDTTAIVLLPDHLHTIWTLPTGETDYSKRWSWIKRRFSLAWVAKSGAEQPRSESRRRERRRGIWQRRFWEHAIRDEADLEAHFDYIHFNSVKHGLARAPRDWPWSSFHHWVRAGHYPPDWAAGPNNLQIPGDAGE